MECVASRRTCVFYGEGGREGDFLFQLLFHCKARMLCHWMDFGDPVKNMRRVCSFVVSPRGRNNRLCIQGYLSSLISLVVLQVPVCGSASQVNKLVSECDWLKIAVLLPSVCLLMAFVT